MVYLATFYATISPIQGDVGEQGTWLKVQGKQLSLRQSSMFTFSDWELANTGMRRLSLRRLSANC